MLTREHLPGAAHPCLHFVDNEQYPVLIANASQSIQKTFRRRHVTPFTLHGLDDDGRNLFGRRRSLEQTLLDPVERALTRATITTVSRTEWITKLVRIRHVHDVERLSLETFALCCFRRRQRKRAEGSSVKTVEEPDELFTTSRVHRELECSLDCLSTAVGEVRAGRRLHGHDRVEFLGELRHVTIIVISAAHVDQLCRLVLNRFHDI